VGSTLLDTGALYGLLIPRDQHHAEALALFEALPAGERVAIPTSVLLELHRLILYRSKDPRLALAVLDQLQAAYLLEHPQPEDYAVARRLLGRFDDQTISLADAVLAAMADRLGARVLTFDRRHFGLMGVTVVAA
jgi:predicted nucleic acid-binding protein